METYQHASQGPAASTSGRGCADFLLRRIREDIVSKKSQNCGLFPYAQPHSIAFGGVFPNIIEAILVDEISTK